MNHQYDRHAEKCFGMKENRNKENLKEFGGKARSFIESPETEKINGSYRYETPAYFYKEKDGEIKNYEHDERIYILVTVLQCAASY